ncbi:hypothetical protein GlitD10_0954 [Gloeomargarita lithophora Alchichica-D10]|uniref:Uncharacterized protein n=2 Tax=Gloeomargarita TaxID=1188227 RepID=A0A1J0ABG2_9CYAN|nr:hypothetical protein GlitD10_0954 [Gloeomargarita lithophora Alchichica-D10]
MAWQNIRRPSCQLCLRWQYFYLKLANGLEIRGQREQLAALTVLVLAYLATPPPPATLMETPGELVPLGESLPVSHRYALQFGGLAPAMNLTLQELHDLAWVLEAAKTPRFPWWQQWLGWLAAGVGLALALTLAWLPRPVQMTLVTRLIPGAALKSVKPLPNPPPTPPPGPTITLNTVTNLPPPPPVGTIQTMPLTMPLPAPPGDIAPMPTVKTAAPPELAGVQNYFRQRWQPPATLQQPLTYRLVVTPQGTLSQIMPLSAAAGLFLDQTPMPLVGEAFMGTIPKTATIQLELAPNGQVRVWFEGWEQS